MNMSEEAAGQVPAGNSAAGAKVTRPAADLTEEDLDFIHGILQEQANEYTVRVTGKLPENVKSFFAVRLEACNRILKKIGQPIYCTHWAIPRVDADLSECYAGPNPVITFGDGWRDGADGRPTIGPGDGHELHAMEFPDIKPDFVMMFAEDFPGLKTGDRIRQEWQNKKPVRRFLNGVEIWRSPDYKEKP